MTPPTTAASDDGRASSDLPITLAVCLLLGLVVLVFLLRVVA